MKTDELLRLAENPQFIEGIYNYCDRWCEKCPVTGRCLLYASTPPHESDNGSSDEPQNEMIRQLEESFELAIDLLNELTLDQEITSNHEEAHKRLIEIKEDLESTEGWHERATKRNELMKSPLFKISKKYVDKTHHWLMHCDAAAKAKDEELSKALILHLPERNPEKEIAEIKDALDVVHWYHVQIHVKLVRAQTSRSMENMNADQSDGFPKDADASAKVALIGIDKSIGSWEMLLRHFPEEEVAIFELLGILQQLRKMTEQEFPEARGVMRMGLDTVAGGIGIAGGGGVM